MTPDQEALKITTAWGCGGDSGAMAMVRAVLVAERERCARIADIIGIDHGPQSDAHMVAASIRSLSSDGPMVRAMGASALSSTEKEKP